MHPIGVTLVGDSDSVRRTGGDDEVLYQNERTRVVRRHWDGDDGADAFILKEPRGPGATQRLRHEIGLLRRLAGIDGVPVLAVDEPVDGAIAMIDRGGCRWRGHTPTGPAPHQRQSLWRMRSRWWSGPFTAAA